MASIELLPALGRDKTIALYEASYPQFALSREPQVYQFRHPFSHCFRALGEWIQAAETLSWGW